MNNTAANRWMWLGLVLLTLVLYACAPGNVVVLIPDPDGKVGQVTVNNQGGSQTLSQSGEATFMKDANTRPEKPVVMPAAEIKQRFGVALAARPAQPVSFLLYFRPNSTELVDNSRALRPEILAAIKERSSVDVSVVGHSDTTGNDAYNLRLSRQRAETVAEWLIAEGVEAKHLEITSHGKRRLLIPTGDNVDEPRNRRVEVTVR